MKWWVFLPAAVLAVAMDATLMPVLAWGGHVPSLALVLLAFVALHATRVDTSLWAGLLLGFLADVTNPALVATATGTQAVPILGPHMLGFAGAAWVVATAGRRWLNRRGPFAMPAATFLASAAAATGFLAVAGLRASYADATPLWGAGSAASAFGGDLLGALWTAVVALPVGWLLMRTIASWDFEPAGYRFAGGARSPRAGG